MKGRFGAAIYLFGTLMSRVGAIVLIPLYTRRLTPEAYGEYALATSLLQLLPVCATLGLTAGISRVYFGAEDPKDGAREASAVGRGIIGLSLVVLGMVGILVAAFAGERLLGVEKRYWLLVVAASIGAAIYVVPSTILRAAQRPVAAVTLDLAVFLASAGAGIVFVLGLGRGLSGAIEAFTVAWLAVGVFAAGFVLLRLPRPRGGETVRVTRASLGFSLAFVPHAIASWFQLTADRWVLQAFGATAVLGTYYLAVQLTSPIAMVVAAFNDAEAPRLGEVYRDAGTTGAYARWAPLVLRYLAAAILPAVLLLLAAPILPFVIGHRFTGAIAILPVLALVHAIDSAYYPANNVVFYAGKTVLIPIVTASAAIFGLGLAIVLLPRFGLAGLLASRVAASLLRTGAMSAAAWWSGGARG